MLQCGKIQSWCLLFHREMTTVEERGTGVDSELFERLAESAFVGVLAVDTDGRVVYANRALAAMLGWSPRDLVGRRLVELVAPEERSDGERRSLRRFLRRPGSPAARVATQLEALHRDGHRVPLEVSFTEVEAGGATYYAGFVQDVGERLRNEAEVRRSRRQLQILTDVTRAALDADRLQLALDRIVSFVQETFRLAAVHLVKVEDGGEDYVLAASACSEETAPVGETYVLRRGGVVGRALRQGRAELVLDTGSDPDYVSLHQEVRSELVVPIRYHGRLLGALNLESEGPTVFTPENCAIFETIAEQIAGAVHHASVQRRLTEAQAALQESHRALRRANLRLARLSRTDDLTQLQNRRSFDEALHREWRRALRSGRSLSLLILDLDRFKDLNDAAGHQAGDATLRAVAATVQSWTRRAGEVAARYGGDELAVILPGTDEGSARVLAERLRAAVQELGAIHPATGASVTASIGVATAVPERGGDPEKLLLAADQALYRAKAGGRNRIELGRLPRRLERARSRA
jgi:diguanylate cyclase (GGDEF)-like protein/PAS domain S-box-containing protein